MALAVIFIFSFASGASAKSVGPLSQTLPRSVAEIRVDIDAKHFPAQKINDKVNVELRGEVAKDFMETPEIYVDVLIVLC